MPPEGRQESESETRRSRIDPRLTADGWTVVPYRIGKDAGWRRHAVAEYPTSAGPADYALFLDGQLVGIVEAKRTGVGPQGALPQAERYAKGLDDTPFNFRGLRAPFLYSTNGEVIWYHDVRDRLNQARKVARFHTPAALAEQLKRDLAHECDALAALPNAHERLRPYQREANAAVEEAIAARRRRMLLAMATGTGKTFTLVNQIYRLMKSQVARRVLFLVDRRALAAQAVQAFASFDAEPNLRFNRIYEVYSQRFRREDLGDDERFDPNVLPASHLVNPGPQHAFVYVCTIQRMAINLFGRGRVMDMGDESIDDDAEVLKIPTHAFDLIVADECHRGYTTAEEALWRETLDHFDAIKIGLTATPARHTAAYFTDVVYRYEYSRAVREGFLVDYDAVAIRSEARLKGVFLQAGDQVALVDPEKGSEQLDRLEDHREYDAADLERRVTSPESNRKILEEVHKHALDHEARYGRYPKTLIFAVNDLPHTSHADQLAQLAVDVIGRGQGFVQKITGRVDRPLQHIREFRNRPEPRVVVTVDLLSTGVDIPDLEFIVFLRPVKSRILFEQMLGRGTRKSPDLPDKSHFTVFDCFDGTLLEYFRTAAAMASDPPEQPSRTIHEVIEDVWANRDREYNVRCLVRRLQRIAKEMSGDAVALFAARGIPEGDVTRFAAELPGRLRREFVATMGVLRDPGLQELLVAYPRARDAFVRAIEYQDTVDSNVLIRDGLGHEHRPEDYLKAFGRFVRENQTEIQAIKILLSRPRDWSTEALNELRAKLQAAPEHFTVAHLQRAYAACRQKPLVDIISMVKHAAREEAPLLTAPERVARAMERLQQGRDFTKAQARWLDLIGAHLAENLTIGEEDFSYAGLERQGGWGAANRAFGGQLAPLLRAVNEAVAEAA